MSVCCALFCLCVSPNFSCSLCVTYARESTLFKSHTSVHAASNRKRAQPAKRDTGVDESPNAKGSKDGDGDNEVSFVCVVACVCVFVCVRACCLTVLRMTCCGSVSSVPNHS